MYSIKLKNRVIDNFVVEVKDSNREKFIEKIKSYIGPNTSWYSLNRENPLPTYINRFFNEFINNCLIES